MPIQDQMPRGDDDVLRRLGFLEQSYGVLLGLVGSAKALAQAIQVGLGNLASSGTLWQGPVASPSTLAAATSVSAPQGTFSSGINSVGAYNTDVSLLAGARQPTWQHNSGVFGFAPSTIASKTDLGPVPFIAEDVMAVQPFIYHYKGQIAIRDDPDNESYDPNYAVPWDIGLMAEHLIEHNMGCFVFWEADGITPKGINYDLFGAIAPLVVLRALWASKA